MPSAAKKPFAKNRILVSDRKANELSFKSNFDRPIAQLSVLEQSLFFAEISLVSYLTPEQCNIAAGKLGFVAGQYVECDRSQAYWFQNDHDSVVVCCGSEAHEKGIIESDINAMSALAETVGKVHRGFKDEVDQLWPHLENSLKANSKPLWFTGHSLGGAMATICASRCLLSFVKSEPEGLFTFGSPRVGDKSYVSHAKLPHYRWVNNNDIVPRVPPVWLGYRHSGRELYLDRMGKLKNLQGWRRISDRIQGFVSELGTKFRIDHFSDHSIVDYVEHIHELIRSGETVSPIDAMTTEV